MYPHYAPHNLPRRGTCGTTVIVPHPSNPDDDSSFCLHCKFSFQGFGKEKLQASNLNKVCIVWSTNTSSDWKDKVGYWKFVG